jgi:hydroxyacylglutathione hydrolase
MSFFCEPVHTEGIAQLSYLVGDSSRGTAAVIDPRPDCEIYLAMARQRGVAITRIFETPIHADFLSGSRELSCRLGSVPIHVSHACGAEYDFAPEKADDGAVFEFGAVTLTRVCGQHAGLETSGIPAGKTGGLIGVHSP